MLDGLYKYSLYLYTFTSLVHATTYGVRQTGCTNIHHIGILVQVQIMQLHTGYASRTVQIYTYWYTCTSLDHATTYWVSQPDCTNIHYIDILLQVQIMQLHTGYASRIVQIYTILVYLYKFRSCNYILGKLAGLYKYTLYWYTINLLCSIKTRILFAGLLEFYSKKFQPLLLVAAATKVNIHVLFQQFKYTTDLYIYNELHYSDCNPRTLESVQNQLLWVLALSGSVKNWTNNYNNVSF